MLSALLSKVEQVKEEKTELPQSGPWVPDQSTLNSHQSSGLLTLVIYTVYSLYGGGYHLLVI